MMDACSLSPYIIVLILNRFCVQRARGVCVCELFFN